MEDVITRIKGYVTTIYPTILTDLNIDEAYLQFMVEDIVDRALVFMNREQLVDNYEEDLVDYPDLTDDFWKGYEYPIPQRLEKVIAKLVVQSTRTVVDNNTAEVGNVSSVTDNGQSVSFRDKLSNFFSSSDDSEVFSGSLALLQQYRLASVGSNDYYQRRQINGNPY